jgi:phosphoribosylformylglycinamidine cyclo-ligase
MTVMAPERSSTTYEKSGVGSIDDKPGFKGLLAHLSETLTLRPGAGRPLLGFGHYASVLDIGGPQALAISTDGVGTKAIVAQMMDKYDTIGIDCVAMNANDVICVGAEPIAMLDYIAVEAADDRLLDEIGKGLLEGARQANISIPGGEISQIREIIRSERPGYGFDLVGTCIGLVDKKAIIGGDGVEPGDVIVGLGSSGIHSNGLTLAREALLSRAGLRIDQRAPELGRNVGEELLEPTLIYVRAVLAMLAERLPLKALFHITGEGFLNLARVQALVGFRIESLPEPQPIFRLIQQAGSVSDAEMFRVFNMGVGFCLIVAPDCEDRAKRIAESSGFSARTLGRCVADAEKRVWLEPKGLVGKDGRFTAA